MDDLVLAISTDNRMVHVGPADALLPHLTVGRAAHATAGAASFARVSEPALHLEYYNSDGERITQPSRRFGPLLSLSAFAPYEKDFDELVLLARIEEGLSHLQTFLDGNPSWGQQPGGQPAITEVPRPTGSYREILTELADLFYPLDPHIMANRGNWFHNLWHAATGT